MSPWRRRQPPRPPRTENDPEHYSRCFIHETAEHVDDDTWRICPECGHVYQSAEDLVDQHNLLMDAVGADLFLSPRYVNTIVACPLCAHDF